DFSFPKTEEEIATELLTVEEKKESNIELSDGQEQETITVQPIKSTVSFDDFSNLDLRVCEIVKCQEIRKSHNCYKLTVNDGIGQRVIVSSIKNDYQPEQLVGKKIVVLVNLEPTRITGVTSEGMLLATSADSGRCRVVFVDNHVPVGSTVY
ncbi:MAG: lysine--tRNA ligase, partial [Oscillospiraceae bacterium]|nr:lysine--tRNA ligase [Oscillospiraceae bacterium]